MIAGSGAGSVPRTNGSGRPKSMLILEIRIRLRIRIPNTANNNKNSKIRDLYCGDEIPDVVVEELGTQEGLEVDLSNKQ